MKHNVSLLLYMRCSTISSSKHPCAIIYPTIGRTSLDLSDANGSRFTRGFTLFELSSDEFLWILNSIESVLIPWMDMYSRKTDKFHRWSFNRYTIRFRTSSWSFVVRIAWFILLIKYFGAEKLRVAKSTPQNINWEQEIS